MIKKLLYLFTIVFLFTSFAPSKDLLIGYWKITKVVSTFGKRKKRNIGNGFILQFREDGVVVSGRRVEKKKEAKSGTYSFDPETMQLEMNDVGPQNEEPLIVLKLTKSKLVFKDKLSTVYLKKIKE